MLACGSLGSEIRDGFPWKYFSVLLLYSLVSFVVTRNGKSHLLRSHVWLPLNSMRPDGVSAQSCEQDSFAAVPTCSEGIAGLRMFPKICMGRL